MREELLVLLGENNRTKNLEGRLGLGGEEPYKRGPSLVTIGRRGGGQRMTGIGGFSGAFFLKRT